MRRVALLVLVLALTAAPPAAAYIPSSPELDIITEHVRKPGALSTVPQCGTVCSELYMSEHRVMPNQPTSQAMHGELAKLRQRAGLLPNMKNLISGRLIPAVGAATLGWTIGGALNQHVLHIGIEKQTPSPSTQGYRLQGWSGDRNTYGYYGITLPRGTTYGFVTQWTPNGTTWEEVSVPQGTPATCYFSRVIPKNYHYGTAAPGGICQSSYTSQRNVASIDQLIAGPGDGASGTSGGVSDRVAGEPIQGDAGVVPDPGVMANRQTVGDELLNNPQDYPVLLQFYESKFQAAGGEATDPRGNYAPVPDCTGVSYNVCVQRLQDAGFGVYSRSTRSFGAAVPLPQAQPAEVFATNPAAGSKVATDTQVVVDTNPDQASMPFVMPDLRGMTASEARTEMEPFGATSPDTAFETLPDSATNLEYGPGEAVSQQPAPGERAQYGTEPAVKVNPMGAPIPGGTGGACGLKPPSAAFNLSPLSSQNLGTKIPFSLIGFLGGAADGVVTASARPDAGFSVLGVGGNLSMLGDLDPAIGAFRLALAFLLWLGVGWFLYGRTIGRDT